MKRKRTKVGFIAFLFLSASYAFAKTEKVNEFQFLHSESILKKRSFGSFVVPYEEAGGGSTFDAYDDY